VIEYAARLLPRIAPDLTPPVSVRRTRGELDVVATDPLAGLPAAVDRALDRVGSVGLIVPDALLDDVVGALADRPFAVVGTDDREQVEFDIRLDVVPASLAKGLEFDHVVLLEPAAIVAGEPDELTGLRRLYVCLTRAVTSLSNLGRRNETTLSPERNPRARALAMQLRAQSANDADFARVVLAWFRDNGLEYTLEPGVTSIDSVDTTLFDSKRGFCGHFASAYAMMMRAAGVPAHVVTGYLGGEWNPVGGYLIVRQADAHAWTEVWLEGKGWIRIDPTAMIAPGRLESGIFDLLPESLPAASSILHNNAFLFQLEHIWDGANQWWQERVLEFNTRSQLDLLRKFGIDSPDLHHLGWAFAAGLVMWITWVSLTLRRGVARIKPDRIGRAWLRATRKLARVAPARAAAEGPMAYARRVGEHRPDLAERIVALASLYATLRFGRDASHQDIVALEREVRNLAV